MLSTLMNQATIVAVATSNSAAHLDGDNSTPTLVFAVGYAGGLVQGVGHHRVSEGKVEGQPHLRLPDTHQVE